MARPRRPWFRVYVEAFADRKLRQLAPETRFLFIACLGIARQACIPGFLVISERQSFGVDDIADFAAMKPRQVQKGLDELTGVGLLDWCADLGCWAVPRWSERQYESDDVTERTRRHRERKERSNDVSETFPGTPPETEDREQIQIPPKSPLPEPDYMLNVEQTRTLRDAIRQPLALTVVAEA